MIHVDHAAGAALRRKTDKPSGLIGACMHAKTNHHPAGAEPFPRRLHRICISAPSEELLDSVSKSQEGWTAERLMVVWMSGAQWIHVGGER